MATPKSITINYLENIKREIEDYVLNDKNSCTDLEAFSKKIEIEYISVTIKLVEESEDEDE